MLRVSKVEEWLRRAPTRPEMSTHGDCVVIRSARRHDGRQGSGRQGPGRQGQSLTPGLSSGSADSKALSLQLAMIPPGTRGTPHFHADHESAVYTVSGQTEVWHGEGLLKRTVVRAGDFMYIPPGTPHLTVNRGTVTAITIVARADEQDSVAVELPRHLADLLSLPVTVQ